MRKSIRSAFVVLLFCLVLPAAAAEITVFGAASLSNVLKELGATWEKHSGDKVIFNFDGSNNLARQIAEGAPADIFFSADEAKMDQLQKKGLIVAASRRSLLLNTLVVVVAADSTLAIASAQDLKKVRVLALAEPQSVPAGIYAKEYLRGLGLWPALIDKVIPTDNVRGALAAVEAGNADAAIVYKTDALISKKVKVAFEVPLAAGPKISYPVALVADSKVPAAAAFLDFLAGEEAKAAFLRFGFLLP
jgi:molybdate transport system substrate-binding protein